MLTQHNFFKIATLLITTTALFFMTAAQAQNISDVAGNLISTISNVDKLLVAIAYIVGIGYALSAIIKFKNHKENPQQVPLSMPVIELCVALSLIFLPTLIPIFEQTLLEGSNSDGNYQATTNLPSFSELNPNDNAQLNATGNNATNYNNSNASINTAPITGVPQTFEHNGQIFVMDNQGRYIPVAQVPTPYSGTATEVQASTQDRGATVNSGNDSLRSELENQLTAEQQALLEAYIHSRGQ